MARKVIASSAEPPNPLELAQSKILRLADEAFRTSLMEALIDSLTIDRNSRVRRPTHPPKIAADYELDLDVLWDYKILVDKQEAVVFLGSIGKNLGASSFARTYGAKKYQEIFKAQPIAYVKNKKIVYTYSEVQVLTNHTGVTPSLRGEFVEKLPEHLQGRWSRP